MPERPDLEYVVPILADQLTHATIADVDVRKPVVFRMLVPGKIETLLAGKTIQAVARRLHFVVFDLGDLHLIIHPMLAGRFLVAAPKPKPKTPADTALRLLLSDGRQLLYRDDVQMGKVYLVEPKARDQIPGFSPVGVDVLNPKAFTHDQFRKLARCRRDQAKVFLMDKSALDSMGNAYADEVLFEARIHPKTMVRSLTDDDLDRLHDAIVSVLTHACKTIADTRPPTDLKIRDFLSVRGRPGEPCPRCKTKLRKAGVHGHDAIFCPECQVDVRSSSIVDWRKLKA